MINYRNCSMEELIMHLMKSSRQVISSATKRYEEAGNEEVVEKLRVAKIRVKILKLEEEI